MNSINKRRYILAFIITAAIFFLGFFFGFLMDMQRVNYFQGVNQLQELNIRSLQLQNDLINNKDFNNQCSVFRYMFDKTIIELENNGERLELYQQQSKIQKDDYDILRRQYALSQINFWSISKKLQTSCVNSSDFVTVLYFFSDSSKCTFCDSQAAVLNYYKLQLKQNILVFAINEDLTNSEPAVSLLKNAYGVDTFPTIIIGNMTYHSYLDKPAMKKILCDQYRFNETRSVICK